MAENTESTAGASNAGWGPLIAACMAQFVMVVDTSMMAVAVPAIVRDLGTTVSAVQAAIALYPLITGALMLTGGKVASILGPKRAFIIASLIFGAGALLATFALNVGMLTLGWAVIEGLGAAVLVPLNYVLIIRNYTGRQRVTGFAVLSGVSATAGAVGPLLGGFFTDFLTWRVGFGLQVLGILLAVLVVSRMKDVEGEADSDIDWLGTFLSALGFTMIVIAIILAPQYGWWEARRPFEIAGVTLNPFDLSPVPFMIGIGLASFTLFLHWSGRRRRQGRSALLRPGLLRIRQFNLGVVVEGTANMTFDGLMFMLPLFFQIGLGLSAFDTGLALLPLSIASLVISLLVSRLTGRLTTKSVVQIGMVVMTFGLIWFWAVIKPAMSRGSTVLPFVLIGLGAGTVIALMSAITLNAVSAEESSEASSVSRSGMRIARSLGTAILGSMFLLGSYTGIVQGVLRAEGVTVSPQERTQMVIELEDAVNSPGGELQTIIESLPAEVQAELRQISTLATIDSAQDTVLFAAAFIILALLISTFLKSRPEETHQAAKAGASES